MNMQIYRVKITGDKYPSDYTVQASGWPTAIARAIKEWKHSRVGKGSRTDEMKIHAVKGGKLLTE